VRPYFAYDKVEAGILDTAAKIFNVQFKAVKNAKVWHPSVTTFDVIDHGKRVGRTYLDMHPREGKDKWFSSAPVVPGIRGRQVPEGMLICNFSGGVAGDPGLMQYDEVVTYFHEFGHLMHHILGSQNRWSNQGGFNVEGDFVEAPSQMLEEFFSSRTVLAPFARHYQTGEVISQATVDRMNAAGAFGRGGAQLRQLFYGSMSLGLHDRAPAKVDLDAQLKQYSEQYSPFTFVEGNRMYSSFTHLVGYSSNYYTYILDKVIAIDFYAQFNRAKPLEGPMAKRYRQAVIDPGATKPAAELVKDFLGRPQNMDAYKAWIGVQFTGTAGK
jgi:thimet oligopeptidase